MADLTHVTEYAALARHRQEMDVLVGRRRLRLALVALAVAVTSTLGFSVSLPLGVMLVGIGAMALFFAAITGGSSVPHHVMSGVEGEARVLDTLAALDDDHVIFNQCMIPDPALPNGRRELDFLVVGPRALHVVEVKNTAGLIHVDDDSRQWQVVRRAGCGSRPGWNAIDNPLRQVRAQVQALERWLLEHGLAVRVNSMVCFARSDAGVVHPEGGDLPVVTTAELLDRIAVGNRTGRLASPDRQQLIRLLHGRTAGTLSRAA